MVWSSSNSKRNQKRVIIGKYGITENSQKREENLEKINI